MYRLEALTDLNEAELLKLIEEETGIEISAEEKEIFSISLEESYNIKETKRDKYIFTLFIDVPFFSLSEKKKKYSYVIIEHDVKNEFLLNCAGDHVIFLEQQKDQIRYEIEAALHYVKKLIKLKNDILEEKIKFDYRYYRRKELHVLKPGKKFKIFNINYLKNYLKLDSINDKLCYEYDDYHRTVIIYENLKSKISKKNPIGAIPLFPSISNIDLFFQDFDSLKNIVSI